MKKQLLSIFALMSFGAVTAQITITQADVAPLGYVIFRGTDTTYTETLIGPGGTGMSWDFSGIVDDEGDTLAISDPTVLPSYTNFPSSNIAIINGGGTAYGILNSSSLNIIGQTAIVAGTDIVVDVNPAEIIANFPANYADSYFNSSRAFGEFPFTATGIDSARVISLKEKQVDVDAWGSLIIPFGTFNVIRVKEEIVQFDTIDIHTTGFPPFIPGAWTNFQVDETHTTHYSFWANGIGFPVMEIDSIHATGEVNVTWVLQTPQVGIKEQVASTNSMVYPNPAKDLVTIKLSQNISATIEVTDVLGKQVKTLNNQKIASTLNVADLMEGIYVYKVTYANGKAESGRFVISK
jgi:hypothetical protein